MWPAGLGNPGPPADFNWQGWSTDHELHQSAAQQCMLCKGTQQEPASLLAGRPMTELKLCPGDCERFISSINSSTLSLGAGAEKQGHEALDRGLAEAI